MSFNMGTCDLVSGYLVSINNYLSMSFVTCESDRYKLVMVCLYFKLNCDGYWCNRV